MKTLKVTQSHSYPNGIGRRLQRSLMLLLDVIKFLLKGGSMIMIDMYVALVIAKRRTLVPDSGVVLVPARYQDAVRVELRALGLDDAGDPLVV